MKRLEGKSAVVTGAASGIGRAGAMLFAEQGASVVIIDRSPDVEATAEAIRRAGGRAIALVGDASREADVAEVIQVAAREHAGLDICYANAGISGDVKVFDDLTADDWIEILSVNLVGAFLAIKHAARVMVPARRGSIICTASIAALRSGGGALPPYSASKAGVISLVQTSASQFGHAGIRVNAVCPGLIDETGMGRPLFTLVRKYGVEQQMTRVIPLRRGGLPQEVAQAALFLACDESSYVTGHILRIDGGWSTALASVPMSMLAVPAEPQG